MGLGKWRGGFEASTPAVDSRWQAKFGRAMTAADIDARSTPRLCRCKSLRLSIFRTDCRRCRHYRRVSRRGPEDRLLLGLSSPGDEKLVPPLPPRATPRTTDRHR